jgi:hypothetical protein
MASDENFITPLQPSRLHTPRLPSKFGLHQESGVSTTPASGEAQSDSNFVVPVT